MACPLQALQGVTLQVHRVSGTGRLCVDHLMGTQPGAEDTVIPLLIWKGHMRVLDPGDDTSAAELGHRWAREGKLARELVAVGWEELLDEGPDPSVPGKPPACAHCKGAGNRAGRAAPRAPASFHEHPAQAQDALLKACARPLAYDPIFAYGIIGQEVYAGAGGGSSALRAEGFPVLEPIEYFEDPLHERGPRPEHDVLDPAVQARIQEAARAPPGPDAANVWCWGAPCGSYTDLGLMAQPGEAPQGTRTWERPEGDGSKEFEVVGNRHTQFTCDTCNILFDEGKEFLIESSWPSGRYPKIWDQPAMVALRRRTGAMIVPIHMCAWGKSPSDDPSKRYHKGSWWLVTPRLYLYALLLARRCPRDHEHVELKGALPGTGVKRPKEAQEWAPRLCAAWAKVLKGAFHRWTVTQLRRQLAPLWDGQGASPGSPARPEGALQNVDFTGIERLEQRGDGSKCGRVPPAMRRAQAEWAGRASKGTGEGGNAPKKSCPTCEDPAT